MVYFLWILKGLRVLFIKVSILKIVLQCATLFYAMFASLTIQKKVDIGYLMSLKMA